MMKYEKPIIDINLFDLEIITTVSGAVGQAYNSLNDPDSTLRLDGKKGTDLDNVLLFTW